MNKRVLVFVLLLLWSCKKVDENQVNKSSEKTQETRIKTSDTVSQVVPKKQKERVEEKREIKKERKALKPKSNAVGFGTGTGSGFSGSSNGNLALQGISGSLKGGGGGVKCKRVRRVKRPSGAKSSYSGSSVTTHNLSGVYEQPRQSGEQYKSITENSFMDPLTDPLSTVSIDVDNGSYTNLRMQLNRGSRPQKNSIRIEECLNYFDYNYDEPTGKTPFSIFTEVGTSPWDSSAQLLHIGLKGKSLTAQSVPRSNLVFLLDVSGSMSSANKLPLLQQSLPLLLDKLSKKDRVSIVVYAGAAGVVLQPTSGDQKKRIRDAIYQLRAGGSTAGGQGIELAYRLAQRNFIKGGNNRVILATDGDFNVGVSSNAALIQLIQKKRESGIALTVLGFGTGNYQDARMEQIANKGNGNYFYIDNILEAKKVLSTDMLATIHTIAKDVKLQIEFNPAVVSKYRLVGYVNRKMATKDFDDDTKDAGELGAGHTVTAIYEIVPKKAKQNIATLRYQRQLLEGKVNELGTVKLRYKKPQGVKSTLRSYPISSRVTSYSDCSEAFRFSAAVAEFVMKLNGSEQVQSSFKQIIKRARSAKGRDYFGYRSEFIALIEKAEMLYR